MFVFIHTRRDFWAVAVALLDQLTASRHVPFLEYLIERPAHSHAHMCFTFRPSFLCLFPLMLPAIIASTRRVPRVIPLLNPHHQNTSPLSMNPYSPSSHRKRERRYAGSQIAASVAGTTRRIRLASRRKWSLVTSVVVVVGFYSGYTPRILLTYARPSNLHGPWHRRRSCPFLPLEVRRMQDV